MATFVGFDVSAATVDMAWRTQGRAGSKPLRFAQTPAGHAAAVKRVLALQPTRVVLEATGVYYLDLAVALAQAGLPVSVINPKSFHHFTKLKLATSKTDGLDAALLAEYSERMQPELWTPPSVAQLALRDVGRQINRLTKSCTQAKNRLHAFGAKQNTLALLVEDEKEAVALLERRLERLTRAALELIAQSPQLTRQARHLQAAKGIAETSAICLLAELCVLPKHLKASQVSRHAGLDVKLCQSGTSLHKPGRLSKAGNAYLRAALYMPSLSAKTHDPHTRAFFNALVGRGKKKMQALCAVMRKNLTGIWACIQNDEPFDSSKLFSDIHLAKT